jgi:hypothetical protein
MIRFLVRGVAGLGWMCTSPALAQAATAPRGTGRRASARAVFLLDNGWRLYTMPDFQLWPPEQQITAAQIRQLKVPELGNGWQPIQVSDDYARNRICCENRPSRCWRLGHPRSS